MGGFEFGIFNELDPAVGLICFITVVVFVVSSDFITEIFEFFVKESSPLSHQMVECIYKELMLMGLVSFTVVMIETGEFNNAEQWLESVDFFHILLFYYTLFFVMHAVYLMISSANIAQTYLQFFNEPASSLLERAEQLEKKSSLMNIFERHQMKSELEFSLSHLLLRDKYVLPKEFNFAVYLRNCSDRFAVKTINRSSFTWVFLIIVMFCNYIRSTLGLECAEVGEGVHPHEEELTRPTPNCAKNEVYGFLFFMALVVLYTLILLGVSRFYKKRMLEELGILTLGDYVPFFKFAETEWSKIFAEEIDESDLQVEIEDALDLTEYDKSEHEIRVAAEFLKSVFMSIRNSVDFVWSLVDPLKAKDNMVNLKNLFNDDKQAPSCNNKKQATGTGLTFDLEGFQSDEKRGENNTIVGTINGDGVGDGVVGANGKDKIGNLQKSKSFRQVSATMISIIQENNAMHAADAASKTKADDSPGSQNHESEKDGVTSKHKHAHNHSNKHHRRPTHHSHKEEADPDNNATAELETIQSKLDRREQRKIRLFGVAKSVISLNKLHNDVKKDDGAGGGGGLSVEPGSRTTNNPLLTKQQSSSSIQSSGSNISDERDDSPFTLNGTERVSMTEARAMEKNHMLHHLSLAEHFLLMKQKNSNNPTPSPVPNPTDSSFTQKLCSTTNNNIDIKSDQPQPNQNFYLFGKPILYFRAVELCITLNCFTMALWVCNYITLVDESDLEEQQKIWINIAMLVPFLLILPCIGRITRTCSLLSAISTLNLPATLDVLEEQQEMKKIAKTLRDKFQRRQRGKDEEHLEHALQKMHTVFKTVDVDGSGEIDYKEFKLLLRGVNLSFSHERSKMLFRAIDISGDGLISEVEFMRFLLPNVYDHA